MLHRSVHMDRSIQQRGGMASLELLRDAALAEFASAGYTGASLRLIAERAERSGTPSAYSAISSARLETLKRV